MSRKKTSQSVHIRLTQKAEASLEKIKELTGKTATEIINAALQDAKIININEGREINEKLAYIHKEVFDGQRRFEDDVAALKSVMDSVNNKLGAILDSGADNPTAEQMLKIIPSFVGMAVENVIANEQHFMRGINRRLCDAVNINTPALPTKQVVILLNQGA